MNRIKELRKAKKVTQQRLADEMHVARTTVTMWEQGTKPDIDLIPQIADYFGVSVDYLFGRAEPSEFGRIGNLSPASERLPHRVPLFGDVAAGQPIYADGEIRDYVDAPCEADYALTVKGDSMYPDYHDGDIVYILRRDDVPDGAVAVILIDDEATLKRVYKRRGGATLASINPKYSAINVENEFGGVRIIGIPCGFTRMFKGDAE